MTLVNRLSIRARITVGTLLLAALFFAGSAAVIHRQVEAIVQDSTVKLLESDALPFAVAIRNEPGDSFDSPGEGQLIQLENPAGAVVLSTFPTALTNTIRSAAPRSETQSVTTGNATYLTLEKKVPASDGVWVVRSAQNEAVSDLVIDELNRQLVFGLIVLTLMFGALSWLLTGAALRPVSRLRDSATILAAQPTSKLLPVGPAADEISKLAGTLNTLIVGLREAADREKQLVSDASHELRTPLAILLSQLELIHQSQAPVKKDEISAALVATQRLIGLATNLLALSRVEAATDKGTARVGDLGEHIAEAVDQLRLAAASTDTTIEYSVDLDEADSSGFIDLSVADFRRILDNLMTNATTAVAGTGECHVRLTSTDTEVHLTIDDTGPGMGEAFLPYAFDRFSREDLSRELTSGTGLGLSIVKALVESASGTIRLANVPSGFEVAVALPIRKQLAPVHIH
jgi:two-component system OmpR family sensor kinase